MSKNFKKFNNRKELLLTLDYNKYDKRLVI